MQPQVGHHAVPRRLALGSRDLILDRMHALGELKTAGSASRADCAVSFCRSLSSLKGVGCDSPMTCSARAICAAVPPRRLRLPGSRL